MSSPHGDRDVAHGRLAGLQGRSSPKRGSDLGLSRVINPFIHGPRSGSGRDWKPCVRSPSVQTRRLRFSTNARLGDLRTVRHSGGQIGRGKTSWATRCHAFVCLFLLQPVEWFEALHRRLGLLGNQQATHVESGTNALAKIDGLVVLSTSGEHIPTEQPSDQPYPISHTTALILT